ncbi:hypothetical protein PFISCL1PPCAC_11027, partial [Pristionchus fissidentatus]
GIPAMQRGKRDHPYRIFAARFPCSFSVRECPPTGVWRDGRGWLRAVNSALAPQRFVTSLSPFIIEMTSYSS